MKRDYKAIYARRKSRWAAKGLLTAGRQRKPRRIDTGRWSIVDLCDSAGRVRWSVCQHKKSAPCWLPVYELCQEIGSKLAAWFCELKEQGLQPVVKTWLGGAVGLDSFAAMRLCRAHIRELQASGECDLNVVGSLRPNRAKGEIQVGRRPLVQIENGVIVARYASTREAARKLGVSGCVIIDWIIRGEKLWDNRA